MSTATDALPRCPVCGWEWRDGRPEFDADAPLRCPRPSCGVSLIERDGQLRASTFRLVDHYTLCVLPFAFDSADNDDPSPRLERFGRWSRRTYSREAPADVERVEYFLPYARRFLFPYEDHSPDGLPRDQPCRHYRFNLQLLGASDPLGAPLEFHGIDTRKDLAFADRLRLESVELIAFSYKVGFLVLRFRGDGPSTTYFDQMSAQALLRPIAPLYRGFAMPELNQPQETRFQVPQLLAFLLAEFGPDPSPPAEPWLIRSDARLPVRPIYDDRMMIYSFSCLDRATRLPDPALSRDLIRRYSVVNLDAEPTTSIESDPIQDADAWLRDRAQGFTKDGGALVVFDGDRFHERYLGHYHATYYFDIFVLATLQRVVLLTLFERLSDIRALTTGGSRGRRLLRRVRKDLLLFKNQCWFSQITNRERGLVLWKRWHSTFETQTLLAEVNEQSEELDSYLQSRHRERVEWLIRLAGFLATAVPAIFGLNALLGDAPWVGPLRWGLLLALIVGSSAFVWFMLIRPSDD